MTNKLTLTFICFFFLFNKLEAQSITTTDSTKKITIPREDESFFSLKDKSWSFGVNGGYPLIQGDMGSSMGLGYGLSVKKAMGSTLSFRYLAAHGYATGFNWKPISYNAIQFNKGVNGNLNPNANYFKDSSSICLNYKTTFTLGSLCGVYTLNNINFQKEHPKVVMYLVGGMGALLSQTKINQLNSSNVRYDYSTIPEAKLYKDRINNKKLLRGMWDKSYESLGDASSTTEKIGNNYLASAFNAGFGLSYQVASHIELHFESSYFYTSSDLLDGQKWYYQKIPSQSKDAFYYNNIGISYRLGKDDDANWFNNPLALPYKAIIDSKKKLQKVDDLDQKMTDYTAIIDTLKMNQDSIMADEDKDGVSDYFDQELNSPKGSIVDGSGRTIFYKDDDGNLIFTDPSGSGKMSIADALKAGGDPTGTTYSTDPDGTQYKNYPDGTKYKIGTDGKILKTNPDGTTYEEWPDGTRIKKGKDGITYETDPDGKHYKIGTDGVKQEIGYDGAQPDGKLNKTVFNKNDPRNKTMLLQSDGKGNYYTPSSGTNGNMTGTAGTNGVNGQTGQTGKTGKAGANGTAIPGTGSGSTFLPAVFFDTDKSNVKYQYFPELYAAALAMNANPNAKYKVVGNTDFTASEAYNLGLGMRRANAVKKILTSYFGVNEANLYAESRGESQPLTNAKSMDALAVNRRVQFETWDGKTPGSSNTSKKNKDNSTTTTTKKEEVKTEDKLPVDSVTTVKDSVKTETVVKKEEEPLFKPKVKIKETPKEKKARLRDEKKQDKLEAKIKKKEDKKIEKAKKKAARDSKKKK